MRRFIGHLQDQELLRLLQSLHGAIKSAASQEIPVPAKAPIAPMTAESHAECFCKPGYLIIQDQLLPEGQASRQVGDVWVRSVIDLR